MKCPCKCSIDNKIAILLAILIPIFYIFYYGPYGMDTTDFGFFYGYPWRIVQGEIPYRDFYYINPAMPLYLHALWMKFTPEVGQVLIGKIVSILQMLVSAWCGALFLSKIFDFKKLDLCIPLLATAGFVWGIHSFPAMPWHTVDGVFWGALGLFAGAFGWPVFAGFFATASMLTKQSFIFMPLVTALAIFCLRQRKIEAVQAVLAAIALWVAFWGALNIVGAWESFRSLTTGPLQWQEALEAGILIYLRQEWWLPAIAVLPWLFWKKYLKSYPPNLFQPAILYLLILGLRYVLEVLRTKGWTGYGESWPTLFVVLGAVCIFLPHIFMQPWLNNFGEKVSLLGANWRGAIAFMAAITLSWSVAISGGYKAPAFFATPLLFALALIQNKFFPPILRPHAAKLTIWTALIIGLIMFYSGYQYPYVFPQRSLARAALIYDAGQIFPKASGVYVDAKMLGTLRDLRNLRNKYGANYRSLPGFPMAYYLTNDKPAYPSEWLLDWQINGRIDEAYQTLLDRNLIVFFEKDQLDTISPDGYERANYSVPQKVRHNWKIIDETEYFLVMQKP